jgi:hypothetical protein
LALIHAYVYGKVDEIQSEFQITGADVVIMPKLELTNMVMIQDYLPMFLEDRYNEAYGSWNEDEPWEIIYK